LFLDSESSFRIIAVLYKMKTERGTIGIFYGAYVTGEGGSRMDNHKDSKLVFGTRGDDFVLTEVDRKTGEVLQKANRQPSELVIKNCGKDGYQIVNGSEMTPVRPPESTEEVQLGQHRLTLKGISDNMVRFNGRKPSV
jgi:hypothetical protein